MNFNLMQEIYRVLVPKTLNSSMNSFHKPIEERIEPYNSKLLLIPTVSGIPYCHMHMS